MDAKVGSRPKTRIQMENRERILDAALSVFSSTGFRGATVDTLAREAGMTKPNLLYYFPTKTDLYRAVLQRVLDRWLDPLEHLDPDGDPLDQILNYARAKLKLSRDLPEDSRLFANEILAGAPNVRDVLEGRLKALVDQKANVIQGWIADGRINAVDPHHLIFMIWAMTQHYADFAVQVEALVGAGDTMSSAEQTLSALLQKGLSPSV